MSTISLDSIAVEDVIALAHIQSYRVQQQTIHNQMVYVKNNLFIVGKIISFPYDLLMLQPSEMAFWTLTSKAFFDSTIITVDTILAEKGQKFSVPELKRKVMGKYLRKDIDPSIKSFLEQAIDAIDYETRINSIRQPINQIRNHYIAHLDYETKAGINKNVRYGIELSELQEALTIAHELFVVLNFNIYPQLELINYLPNDKQEFNTDIEKILTLVASRSFLLRTDFRSDTNPRLQKATIGRLSEEKLQELEMWRQRVNSLLESKDET